MNSEQRVARVGFVGFGEVNTPASFISERCEATVRALEEAGLEVLSTAPVVDDPAGEEAVRARTELQERHFTSLVVCIAGWVPSWAVLAVIDRFREMPMVLLGLSGWQEGDRFVTTADQAGTTALRAALQEMGYCFTYIVTRLGRATPLDRVVSWCRAAEAADDLRRSRIGMIGYRDMRLYGTAYDPLSLKQVVGPEVKHHELMEIKEAADKVGAGEIQNYGAQIQERWTFTKQPQERTVENSVRLFVALRDLVRREKYDALSYNDVDGIKQLLGFAPAGAMTLFHDELTIPTVPENDTLGSVAQLIVKRLTGQIAAYLEFYEFTDEGALMGVPDYVPAEVVEGPVTVMPNAFGEFGEGLLNVSRLRTGPVTICRLARLSGRYVMHIMTGRAENPRRWEEAGWAPPAPQLPSLEIRFDDDSEDFIQKVLSQHYILSYGNNREILQDFCRIRGIEVM